MSRLKTQIGTLLTFIAVLCNFNTLVAQDAKVVLAESKLKVLIINLSISGVCIIPEVFFV